MHDHLHVITRWKTNSEREGSVWGEGVSSHVRELHGSQQIAYGGVCIQATLPVSMRVKAPAAPSIIMSNGGSAGRWRMAVRGALSADCVFYLGVSFCLSTERALPLRTHLSAGEAASRMQTEAGGQSDMKTVRAEFRKTQTQ